MMDVRSIQRLNKVVHWTPFPSARASYLLARSDVDGGSALNLRSYKWQATICPEWGPSSPTITSDPRAGCSDGEGSVCRSVEVSPRDHVADIALRSGGNTARQVSKARGQR